MGGKVVEVRVNHRERAAGTTKYGSGLKRAIPGLIDCFAVRYMRNRRRQTASMEISGESLHTEIKPDARPTREPAGSVVR
jgi:hypothetical protein